MRPYFEQIPKRNGVSWNKVNRRLDDGIPFLWHHHPEMELTLTLNCSGQRFVGDSAASFDDGDLVLVGPNLPHTWVSNDRINYDGPFVALVAWFDASWLEQMAATAIELAPLKHLASKAQCGLSFSQTARQSIRDDFEQLFDKPQDKALLSLLDILIRLAADAGAEPLAHTQRANLGKRNQKLDRVLTHIHENYADSLRIDDLAEVAALSPSGLHRMFRKHTQTTISDYLINLRIGEACARLSLNDTPIQHIAHSVGYDSLANFNRHFRRLRGMTPREYRNYFQAG